MKLRDRLNELAGNLSWTWHSEAFEIFQQLDPELWLKLNRNPVAFLEELSDEALNDRVATKALGSRITRAYFAHHEYLRSTNTWGKQHVRSLKARPVAYFSAEFGLHESLPIYSGGLGLLSGDHLKASSDLDVPLIGVGLLYTKGYFSQSLDAKGWQQEHYYDTDPDQLPLQVATDKNGDPLRLVIKTSHDDTIHVRAWLANVGRCRLLLLDCNVEENNEQNRALTAKLYGGDSRIRIRQELILGVGGMRALNAMGIVPGVIHLNEGHSAFALLELSRLIMERDGKSFADVRDLVSSMSVFTSHTPVAAGHDRFEPALVEETLSSFREMLGLSKRDFLALGRSNPDDDGETFCMTVLGLRMARYRNAVSNLHRFVTRKMWRSVWPGRDMEDIPIAHITNGIHVGTWLATPMDRLYKRWIGESWRTRMYDPQTWAPIEAMHEEELWELNEILRSQLLEFTRERVSQQYEARGESDPTRIHGKNFLDDSALTIGIARRFTPYKRIDLILGDPERLDRIVNDPEHPVQVIFAGKAHPRDEEGKKLIQRVHEFSRDPRFIGKIVFIENYDIDVSRRMVQGVDLWLNNPRRPLEACGTSGMKAAINGALNLSVLDGWWAEAYDGTNGFAIGDGGEHTDWKQQDARDMESLLDVLENEVVPIFYDRDEDGVPREWVQRQKRALRSLVWRFSSHRMVTDYVKNFYVPAAGDTATSLSTLDIPPRNGTE